MSYSLEAAAFAGHSGTVGLSSLLKACPTGFHPSKLVVVAAFSMKRQASPQLMDCKRTKVQGEVGAISIRSCRAVSKPAAAFEHLYMYCASFIAPASLCL